MASSSYIIIIFFIQAKDKYYVQIKILTSLYEIKLCSKFKAVKITESICVFMLLCYIIPINLFFG